MCSPLEEEFYQTLALFVAYHAAQKKSLHIKISIEGVNILALVDTGAKSSFIQQPLVQRLGLWAFVQPCHQEVWYSNGDIKPMIGEITVPVKVQDIDMPMHAYILHSKGPSLIMGLTFLEANRLLVDCTSQILTNKDGSTSVKCFPL